MEASFFSRFRHIDTILTTAEEWHQQLFDVVLLHWEYIVFLPHLKCFKCLKILFLLFVFLNALIYLLLFSRLWFKKKKKNPVEHLWWKIVIYTCMNRNKAWSLNISTAAQWNSGLENLLTSIMDNHLLQIGTRQKGNVLPKRKNCKASCRLQVLRCHHIYRGATFLSFFFDLTGSGHPNRGSYSWMRQTSAVVGTRLGWLIPPR